MRLKCVYTGDIRENSLFGMPSLWYHSHVFMTQYLTTEMSKLKLTGKEINVYVKALGLPSVYKDYPEAEDPVQFVRRIRRDDAFAQS